MKTLLITGATFMAGAAAAATSFSGDVTNNYINGEGISNGGFTLERVNGIEIGLRGKTRYDESGDAQNEFNDQGNGTYIFMPSEHNAPENRSVFNFDWQINVDFDQSNNAVLNEYTYMLSIDYDPTENVGNTVEFDPITPSADAPFFDHAIGTNATGQGGGTVASGAAEYMALVDQNNIASNSWNLGFFNPEGVDPQAEGLFTIRLAVFDGMGAELASNSIDIQYGDVPTALAPVPLPAGLPLMLAGLGALGIAARRRRS